MERFIDDPPIFHVVPLGWTKALPRLWWYRGRLHLDALRWSFSIGRGRLRSIPHVDSAKRPVGMTPTERLAIPVRSQMEERRLSPFGLNGDDLIGYWQDADGKWWREPPMLS